MMKMNVVSFFVIIQFLTVVDSFTFITTTSTTHTTAGRHITVPRQNELELVSFGIQRGTSNPFRQKSCRLSSTRKINNNNEYGYSKKKRKGNNKMLYKDRLQVTNPLTVVSNNPNELSSMVSSSNTNTNVDNFEFNINNSKSIRSQTSLSSTTDNDLDTNTDEYTINYTTGKQSRDVIIIGGSIAGLSIALYLSQLDPSRHITIYDRGTFNVVDDTKVGIASMAAAGMLAPSSERLPKGHLLDICYSSQKMYPNFINMVESMAKDSGIDGFQYLPKQQQNQNQQQGSNSNDNNLPPWSVGYVSSGGFLAPAFAGDSVATWAPPTSDNDTDADTTTKKAIWLDSIQVRELEPNLHPDVIGGWWFPEDTSVDARRLTCSLRAACVGSGNVQFIGQTDVSSLHLTNGICKGMWITNNNNNNGDSKYVSAKTVIVANGAWMRNLLPVPITSHKGQSISVRMPTATTNNNQLQQQAPPLLRRVLFAQDCYIVPKADGRIVIGATVEAGDYTSHATPGGICHILENAIRLVPALASLPIEEVWAGFRPTTPDKGPIIGTTPWSNLYLAGGYWRNGILLAPKIGYMIAKLVCNDGNIQLLTKQDQILLNAFNWDRYIDNKHSTSISASSRYAASMYPVHTRSTIGISKSVGTELGSYSTARSARAEREQDRRSLFYSSSSSSSSSTSDKETSSSTDEMDAFEKAAAMGKQDAQAYQFCDENDDRNSRTKIESDEDFEDEYNSVQGERAVIFEGTVDALTVGSSTDVYSNDLVTTAAATKRSTTISSPIDVKAGYATIMANKAKVVRPVIENSNNNMADNQQNDPGFRIYYVDPDNADNHIEVPPYTSPGDFMASLKNRNNQQQGKSSHTIVSESASTTTTKSSAAMPPASITNGVASSSTSSSTGADYDEKTFDGYQDIQQANSRTSRAAELQAMKEARKKNRMGQEGVDISKIGVHNLS